MTVKIKTIKIQELTCERPTCQAVWQIAIDKPIPATCLMCKSYGWNASAKQPRRKGKGNSK